MSNAHQVAIVTGASRGIGAGLVAGYRRLGFRVVATSRSIAPSNDERVLAIAGDIRDRTTAQKLVAAAKERFGRIDTLVNNAGIFIAKPFLEYTQEDFDAVTATNVTGLFHITQAVLAELLARQSGHVVNITASLVDQPLASVPAGLAALTKGGLNGWVRAYRRRRTPVAWTTQIERYSSRADRAASERVSSWTPTHPAPRCTFATFTFGRSFVCR